MNFISTRHLLYPTNLVSTLLLITEDFVLLRLQVTKELKDNPHKSLAVQDANIMDNDRQHLWICQRNKYRCVWNSTLCFYLLETLCICIFKMENIMCSSTLRDSNNQTIENAFEALAARTMSEAEYKSIGEV